MNVLLETLLLLSIEGNLFFPQKIYLKLEA